MSWCTCRRTSGGSPGATPATRCAASTTPTPPRTGASTPTCGCWVPGSGRPPACGRCWAGTGPAGTGSGPGCRPTSWPSPATCWPGSGAAPPPRARPPGPGSRHGGWPPPTCPPTSRPCKDSTGRSWPPGHWPPRGQPGRCCPPARSWACTRGPSPTPARSSRPGRPPTPATPATPSPTTSHQGAPGR